MYYYFDSNDASQQSMEGFIRSLIMMLITQFSLILDSKWPDLWRLKLNINISDGRTSITT